MTEEILEAKAKEIADSLPARPKNTVGFLISGEGGFERFHGAYKKKLWDGSGNHLISLTEALYRALMGYFPHADIGTLKAEWCVDYPDPYNELTRWGKRDYEKM